MAARAHDRLGHELVEAHVLGRGRRLAVAGQRDEVADEVAQLLGLLDDVVEQCAPVGLAHRRGVAQHLDVGAHRGHRGAQLVRGVGHQLALLGLRGLQAREHRVEARRHPPDLVVPVGLDAPAEVAGGLDVLGRVGQLGDRRDDAPREEPADARRQRRAEGDERDEHPPQALEDAVESSSERATWTAPIGPSGAVSTRRCSALDVVVGEAAAGVAVGGRERRPGHGQLGTAGAGRAGSRCRWGARAGRSRPGRRGSGGGERSPGRPAAARRRRERRALVEGARCRAARRRPGRAAGCARRRRRTSDASTSVTPTMSADISVSLARSAMRQPSRST